MTVLLDATTRAWIGAALLARPAPLRLLEVGAGRGELSAALREAGFEVRAIDPAGDAPGVEQVALADLEAPAASFDAAVALFSLHHVSPLAESIARLAEVVRPGGRIVVDEFDVDALDERAAAWWLERRRERGADEDQDPGSLVAGRRGHVHPVARLREELGHAFDLDELQRGSYLYRWDLGADLRAEEERLIAAGELPAVGARWVGTRRV